MTTNRTATLAQLHADPMFQEVRRLGVTGLGALFEQDRLNAGGVPSNPAAELPECAKFVGTAGRCAECRTRKALHA